MSKDTTPIFFFSHSRREREGAFGNYLKEFFKDLNGRLFLLSTIPTPGVMDIMTVEQGEDWDLDLTEPLRKCRAFVALFSPLYFDNSLSPNIGKELHMFLGRSPNLSVDANGALKGVENFMPIQWHPKSWYKNNKGDRGRVPAFLSLLSDVPSDDLSDPDKTAAIKHYKLWGMRGCVGSPHYDRILELLIDRLWNMEPLAPAAEVSFADAPDAYAIDWPAVLGGGRHEAALVLDASAAPVGTPAAPPIPLSLVVYHVTAEPFTADTRVIDFADHLLLEPEASSQQDTSVFQDFCLASTAENTTVIHVTSENGVPASSASFISYVKAQNRKGVVTAVLIDAPLWAQRAPGVAHDVIDEIAQSTDWSGPIFIRAPQPAAAAAAPVLRTTASHKVIELTASAPARVESIRGIILDARRDTMKSASRAPANNDPFPMLTNSNTKAG